MKPNSITIWVDGQQVDMMPEYTVGFYLGNAGPEATLYHHGKRVTSKWRLLVDCEVAEDKDKNANTA